MAIEVELPDGSIAEFPDDMSPEQIQSVLQKQFPQPKSTGPTSRGGARAMPAAPASSPNVIATGGAGYAGQQDPRMMAAMGGGRIPRLVTQGIASGIAGVGDAVLNTPNRLWNLLGIVPGMAAQSMGMPAFQPAPDYPFMAQFADRELTPTTLGERYAETVGEYTGGAVAGGGIRPDMLGRSFLAAIGSGAGAQTAREVSPNSMLAELVGAVAGGVAPGAIEGAARGSAGFIRSAVEPLTKSGQERIVGRALQESQSIPGSIAAAQPSVVPGVRRTLAEATADPGIAQFQRAVAMADQPTASALDMARRESNAARVDALRQIAKDDATLSAAERARDNAALKFLRSATQSKTPVNTDRAAGLIDQMLAGRAGQREAVSKALLDVKSKLDAAKTPGAAGAGVDIAYGVRQHIDDLMSGRVGGDQQGAPLARKYLTTVKKVLDREIVKAAPSFRQYLNVYKEGSIPINQMQLGRELLDSATGNIRDPLTGELTLTPAKMGAATENLDAIAARATGFDRAQASRILTPEQQSTITAVNQDLSRQAFADAAARQTGSPTAQNLAGMNMLKQTLGPGGLGLPDSVVGSQAFTSLVANPLNLLYRVTGAPQRILDVTREVLTSPAEAQRIISQLPKRQQNMVKAAILQAMRQVPAQQAGQQ